MASTVQCLLCPFQCILKENQRGICQVRINLKGKLVSLVYGKPATVHVDPIEKKPIFHMLPGSKSFSVATFGCNLGCKYCQNWQLSQSKPDDNKNYSIEPKALVKLAKNYRCDSIAYTYSEPIVFYEYTYDTSVLARQNRIKNVLVSAGFINPAPLKRLVKYLDAANIDLKGFTEEFYNKVCFASLKPVLKTLEILATSSVILEITNLIVPTLNDNMKTIKKMCQWIVKNLGAHIPVHFSRFQPMYKLKNLPPTPTETLINARKTALDAGLFYVYIGNVYTADGETTFCPRCKKAVIKRYGYTLLENHVTSKGKCKFCNEVIYGQWESL
ncbi:MAG: AmmeMemoRadiSam system radical SAM enzyme [Spirochaetes bacterium]|nr:AmmeMemoRadiSam system radical SAM enzyme [Spirochaetota bacterium]